MEKAKIMTMTEIRSGIARKIKVHKNPKDALYVPGLLEYWEGIRNAIEELWKNGFVENFDNDFLRLANGFVMGYYEYDNMNVSQTLDLHCITATRVGVKRFGTFILDERRFWKATIGDLPTADSTTADSTTADSTTADSTTADSG